MDFVNKDRDVRVAVAENLVADGCGTVGERYAVGYGLTFEDGEQSEQVLHRIVTAWKPRPSGRGGAPCPPFVLTYGRQSSILRLCN